MAAIGCDLNQSMQLSESGAVWQKSFRPLSVESEPFTSFRCERLELPLSPQQRRISEVLRRSAFEPVAAYGGCETTSWCDAATQL